MLIFTVTLLILLAIAVTSSFRIMRFPLPWKLRMIFLVTRVVLLGLIASAFLEPVMVFDQLSPQRGPVPVLIDASKSMRLFQNDSALTRGLIPLEMWNASPAGNKRKFIFYTFGDSLAPLRKKSDSIEWSQRHSFLPASTTDPLLRRSNTMLLISDGNWSNAAVPTAVFSNKNVYYLRLNEEKKRPYLQMELPDFPAVSTVDSPLVVNVDLAGISSCANNAILVSVMEGKTALAQRNVAIPARGFFKNNVTLTFTKGTPGRHLYRFEAHSVTDSLSACRYALHAIIPKQFLYTLYNGNPTLNRRFIQLAFKRQRFFVEAEPVAGKTKNLDLLVLFDWDQNARHLMNGLRSGGTVLFIGTLPCSDASVMNASRLQLFRPEGRPLAGNPFDGLDINKLPPPSCVSICKSLHVLPRNVLLAAAAKPPGLPGQDTIDLFFTGRIDNRHYIACAIGDFWRWDFLPLAVEPDEDHPFAFSERLVVFSKETLVNALSEALFLYPEDALTESDSLRFRVSLPAGLPIPADIRVSCKLIAAESVALDTSFMLRSTGISNESCLFKPLPCGAYRIEATAEANNRHFTFADSVFVEEDRSEYMVNGQNTALLQEIAQPISGFSESSLKALFFSNGSEINQSVKKTIHLNRNWPLLMLIFTVFSVEWILRRVLKLD
jgi:hypothetical protein